MHLLLYMRRQYNSPLPPSTLMRRLAHTVPPRPAGLLWWLGTRYLPCWGKIEPAASSFWARMRWGRSSGLVIRGHWQIAPATSPLAGTVVWLIIRPTLPELLTSFSFLAFVAGAIVLSHPTTVLVPLLLPGVMALIWTSLFWLEIRRAERHFKQVLLLGKAAG